MNRVNTISWSNSEVITKKMAAVQLELMRWQKHTLPHEEMANKRTLEGDSSVMIELIRLRDYISDIIDLSAKRNNR